MCDYVILLVPGVGIEPTLSFPNQILSLARLPVSPPGREGGEVSERAKRGQSTAVAWRRRLPSRRLAALFRWSVKPMSLTRSDFATCCLSI